MAEAVPQVLRRGLRHMHFRSALVALVNYFKTLNCRRHDAVIPTTVHLSTTQLGQVDPTHSVGDYDGLHR